MSLVISKNMVLAFDPEDAEGNGNFPIIGWDNAINRLGITSSYAASGFPAINLANPNTASRWRSTHTTTQYLTFDFSGARTIDYVGIARHNLGSGSVEVAVQVRRQEGGNWITIAERVLLSDGPAIVRFAEEIAGSLRLRLRPSGTAPEIAVVHIGKLLVMERGLQQGHVPVHLAVQNDVVTGIAESGDFLGRIVERQALSTGLSFRYLRKAWFDVAMAPFAKAALGTPFFFAWMPEDYPAEAAFCWATSDLRPEAHMMGDGVYLHLDFQIGALIQ